MPYGDWDGKIILHSWGRFRITLAEACVAGDLLSMTGALADGDTVAAHCVACQDGASGDTVWAAMAVEVKKPPTIAVGGGVTAGAHGGAADDVLYLSATAGKLSTVSTLAVKQVCGLCLDSERALIVPGRPAFVAAAAVIAPAPAGGSGAAVGGWDTAANRDVAIATVNAMVTVLKNLGFVKTA